MSDQSTAGGSWHGSNGEARFYFLHSHEMNESTAGGDWLTTSEAAAVLKVSERTVQRRCKAGKLVCREVTTETGQRWEVKAATLAPEVTTGADTIRQGDDTKTQTADKVTTETTDSADRVTPSTARGDATSDDKAATSDDTRLARLEGYAARDLELIISAAVSTAVAAAVEPLQAELRELRAIIEQQAQQGPQSAPAAQDGTSAPGANMDAVGAVQTQKQRREPQTGFRKWLLDLLRG